MRLGGGVTLRKEACNRADNLNLDVESKAKTNTEQAKISSLYNKVYCQCQSVTHGSFPAECRNRSGKYSQALHIWNPLRKWTQGPPFRLPALLGTLQWQKWGVWICRTGSFCWKPLACHLLDDNEAEVLASASNRSAKQTYFVICLVRFIFYL